MMTVERGGQKSNRASGGASLQGGTCSVAHLANIHWMPPEGQCWVVIMAPWTNPGPNIWSLWSPLSLKRTLDSFGLWIQHSSSTIGETQFIFFSVVPLQLPAAGSDPLGTKASTRPALSWMKPPLRALPLLVDLRKDLSPRVKWGSALVRSLPRVPLSTVQARKEGVELSPHPKILMPLPSLLW